jgi:type I site-specific restriction-modification system R (restriction) subunit
MQNVFPNACYIGFTGTPLLKKEKTTAAKFGGFIHKYTMNQAVKRRNQAAQAGFPTAKGASESTDRLAE